MTSSLPMTPAGDEESLSRRDLMLYSITVLSWSASWYALKINSGYSVSPPVTICWRFLMAAGVMFAFVALSGGRLRFSLREHVAFALLGVFMFSTNFIFFYYASTTLVSGLLAVVFSLASVVNLVIGALQGDLAGPRRWVGAALGSLGIAALYWPSLAGGSVGSGAGGLGLVLCLCGTLSFCIGNQVSQALSRRDTPVMSASAWGMAYGAVWSALISVAGGHDFIYDPAPGYTLSLLFLTLISTVVAFWAYLNLVRSIGAGRAAYATVMFPIAALLLSTVVEGYVWTPLAVAGIALALAGNLLVLRSARRRAVPVPTPVV